LNGTETLESYKTDLEKASAFFAAGYQVPKKDDACMLQAFEAFLPSYPWADPIVRKADVQRAFERSEHGQPVGN
jgi:hypothetical protein